MNSPVKTLIPVFAGLFLAGAAFAADTPTPPRPGFGHHGQPGVFQILTPEERLIYFQDVKKKLDTLTVAKFHEWRMTEREKFAKMSPDERKKFAADLDAKWKALPDSKKLELYHEALNGPRNLRGMMRPGRGDGMGPGMGRGMGPGMGPGMGMGPCMAPMAPMGPEGPEPKDPPPDEPQP